jgi:serine/threonine-protein kinase
MPNQNHRFTSKRPDPNRTEEQIPDDWALSDGFAVGGRYTVVRKLAEGGVGDIFLARDDQRGRMCALKLLRPEHVDDEQVCGRFRREADTPGRIPSLHVVEVTDFGHAPELYGTPFFVMEPLEGLDLQQLSDEEGPVPAERVMRFAWQVANALDTAHEQGIVHRDLKPENLFLVRDRYGRDLIKVLDFGVAKMHDEGDRIRATRTGDFVGTPMYMTPEQCLGRSHEVGPTADVWAFGLIVHRLLAGTEYWVADSIVQLVSEIAYQPMPPPSERGADYGKLYDDWFLVCCARDPTQRFQSVGTAAHALALALRT